jgi:hypothetical protein
VEGRHFDGSGENAKCATNDGSTLRWIDREIDAVARGRSDGAVAVQRVALGARVSE